MSSNNKSYNNLPEMLNAAQVMGKFQNIHNLIRKDYMQLLDLTESYKEVQVNFDALYRASLRSLFSLIEADISGLNTLDGYSGFDDRKHSLIFKFKKTYKQIAKTWNKEEIQQRYFSAKIEALIALKQMRDELVHPKDETHIHSASLESFEKLKSVFKDYDDFVNDLMNNFFVSVSIPINWNSI
ncbi:hypothetical protein I5M32_07885 [Pedobacter sp. SD-b]|uniref:RiboL-PSP-HEPN domain-containing protein n=1 Tax=Pedobacter segetis TaxID=2793069 RepID=A0ABS1BJ17_9SPHI|nr:hypothetical protein [Pedobacter segetis]MBK0382878.1 hypothetical protein [Pedobacter segetis]